MDHEDITNIFIILPYLFIIRPIMACYTWLRYEYLYRQLISALNNPAKPTDQKHKAWQATHDTLKTHCKDFQLNQAQCQILHPIPFWIIGFVSLICAPFVMKAKAFWAFYLEAALLTCHIFNQYVVLNRIQTPWKLFADDDDFKGAVGFDFFEHKNTKPKHITKKSLQEVKNNFKIYGEGLKHKVTLLLQATSTSIKFNAVKNNLRSCISDNRVMTKLFAPQQAGKENAKYNKLADVLLTHLGLHRVAFTPRNKTLTVTQFPPLPSSGIFPRLPIVYPLKGNRGIARIVKGVSKLMVKPVI
jgi:hypothetical protein